MKKYKKTLLFISIITATMTAEARPIQHSESSRNYLADKASNFQDSDFIQADEKLVHGLFKSKKEISTGFYSLNNDDSVSLNDPSKKASVALSDVKKSSLDIVGLGGTLNNQCTSESKGAVRYDYGSSKWQSCSGSAWEEQAGGPGGMGAGCEVTLTPHGTGWIAVAGIPSNPWGRNTSGSAVSLFGKRYVSTAYAHYPHNRGATVVNSKITLVRPISTFLDFRISDIWGSTTKRWICSAGDNGQQGSWNYASTSQTSSGHGGGP